MEELDFLLSDRAELTGECCAFAPLMSWHPC